jgi:hypothetical protein
MSAPHPSAVGTLGDEFVAWCREVRGVTLRWWQRLAAYRILEIDAAGELCWSVVLVSTSRQVGKSTLLAMLAHWRITQAPRFGQPQLAVHTGKDLQVCREVQRDSRMWARRHRDSGWSAMEANGKEEVTAPDGSRWLVRAQDSVYGYAATLPMIDEAWDVPLPVLTEGVEPSMSDEGREQPQLLVCSTAHRRATLLFPSLRDQAIVTLREGPSDVLLLEWSARLGDDVQDRAAWRAASPQWSDKREAMLVSKVTRALAGDSAADDIDDDPVEAFRSQFMNVWAPPSARLLGRDEPLVTESVWDGCVDLSAAPGTGPLVVALEDYFGLGAAVGCAAWDASGSRALVWGQVFPSRALAHAWAMTATETTQPPVIFDPVGLTQMRAALPAMRDLIAEGRLAHDGGSSLSMQVTGALVVPGAAGLSLSPRGGRSDLLRAVAWATQRLVSAGMAPFRVM